MDDNFERIKNILNAMPSAVITVSGDFTIQSWNRFLAQKTQVPSHYAVGRKLNLIYPAISDYLYLITDALRTQKIQAHSNAKIIVNADDLHRFFHIVVYPIPVINHIEAVIRIDDITAQIKSESDLAQIEKLASVGASVAGVAHEINNPLASIMQAAQNILRRIDPSLQNNQAIAMPMNLNLDTMYAYLNQREIIDFVHNIQSEGERASAIVRNMLKFARRPSLMMTKNNLIDTINAGIKLAEMESNVQDDVDFKDITFVKFYPPDPVIVECNAQELEQVVVNIIKNSVQALSTKEGNKEITILVKAFGKEKVVIEIGDNGPGIPAEIIENIFQPFFTTKQLGRGTGLGLSICKNIIVQHHHGTIEATSKKDEFTKFIITLPIKQN